MRSLNNKLMIGGHISGEKIKLNHHGSQERLQGIGGQNYASPNTRDHRSQMNDQIYLNELQQHLN